MTHQELLIQSSHHDKPITFDIRYDENKSKLPLIIFLHGFKGFKDWGHFNHIADYLAGKGFAVLKLNFSHNGTTPNALVDFDDLEAFGNNNFSIELQDLDDILNEVEKLDFINLSQINIVGHSKGGATAIIKSFEDERIKRTATLASVIKLKDRYANELEDWKKAGVFYIHNARTNQDMPLYYQLAEDVLNNLQRFDLPELLKEYSKPLLLIHGAKDETVKLEEFEYAQSLNPSVSTYLIPDTNHTFDGAHPFKEKELHIYTQEALDMIVHFFKK